MFCSKCGRPIPDGSSFCSECGAPVVRVEAPKAEAPEESTAVSQAPKAEAPKAEIPAANPADSSDSGQKQDQKKAKKKGKAGKVLGILLAIVLVLAAGAGAVYYFAKDQVTNFVHVTFDKPADYYQYVAKRNIDKAYSMMPENFDEIFKKQTDVLNSAAHEKVQVKLGDRGKDFLKLAVGTGVDITWVESAAVDYSMDFQAKNDKFHVDAKAFLNDVPIISGLAMLDLKEGVAAFQIPELTEKYGIFSFADDEYDYEELKEIFEKYSKVIESYPDPSYLKEKGKQYMEMYLEQVEEVEKSTETLEADDITMECTSLTVVLREKDIRKLLEKIIDDLKEDEEFEKMVKNMAELADEEPEEFYQEYQKSLEDSKKELEDLGIDRVKLVIYVDKQSYIVGSKVAVDPKEERLKSAETLFVVLNQEDRQGVSLTMKYGSHNMIFAGSGVIRDGKLEGDYRLKYDDKKMMNLSVDEFDLEEAKKGNLSGHFNVKPGSDLDLIELLCHEFGLEDSSPAYVFLSALNLSLDLKLDITAENHSVDLGIQDGGLDIVRVSFRGGLDEAGSIVVPENGIDMEEKVAEYVKEISFKRLMENLKNANVPKDYYEELEELEDELKYYVEYLESIRNSYDYR